MVRNLILCGTGLLLTAALGLLGRAAPAGLAPVGDDAAGQVLGAGKVDCKKYVLELEGACGEDAKPGTNGVGGTKCMKQPRFVEDADKGGDPSKPKQQGTCYECCYSCGGGIKALTTADDCMKKKSGNQE